MTERLYITFGQKYHREPHPRLPGWACDPDGWLEVVADTEDGATALLIEHVGVLSPGSVVIECADIYREWTSADRGYYPKGCLGTISKDGLTRSGSEDDNQSDFWDGIAPLGGDDMDGK